MQLYNATKGVRHLVHCVKMPKLNSRGVYSVELQPLGYARAPLNEAEFKRAIAAVLHALSCLHEQGFAHRDIRWENLLRDDQVCSCEAASPGDTQAVDFGSFMGLWELACFSTWVSAVTIHQRAVASTVLTLAAVR